MERKIIQIAVAESSGDYTTLIALASDGSLWRCCLGQSWVRIDTSTIAESAP